MADERHERALVGQRTGWGKSAVYFVATSVLRSQGFGPTLLISPLLALMRNQIEAAERLGLRCMTVNSSAATTVDELAAFVFKTPGPVFAVAKIALSEDPWMLPEKDGAAIARRFRIALGVASA